MREAYARWVRLCLVAAPAIPALAAGRAEHIVLVADSRRYTGVKALWASLYNDSHLYVAIITIVMVPAVGLVMAKLTDFLLSRLGINLKSRVLAEH